MSDDLVKRLDSLWSMLVDEGFYTKANTVMLAKDRIEELEAKLAKLRTFLDELWDSQGYDARELHDLLKELDGVSDD